ncbi:hypothetical protein CQA16_25470, partial [Enterobacter hormaechei]
IESPSEREINPAPGLQENEPGSISKVENVVNTNVILGVYTHDEIESPSEREINPAPGLQENEPGSISKVENVVNTN